MSANDRLKLVRLLAKPSANKIVLLVLDGLGGLPDPRTGRTELETAHTPNLDQLAQNGICGLMDPVLPGVTPGSSPGHLALFGYDPFTYHIGRGVLEAVGIGFDLQHGDVAARGNFCTIDKKGFITDRRAGRLSTDKCAQLCQLLDGQRIDDVEILVRPVKEHRLAIVFRGENLSSEMSDSDPQQTGVPPNEIKARHPQAKVLCRIANQFLSRTREILKSYHPANMILLRGFSQPPHFPSMNDVYQLKAAAIASYPMYRGLARLVGMDVLETGGDIEEELEALKRNYSDYDYFFIHIKGIDSRGEDGDFDGKVKMIEKVDKLLPELLSLKPEVLVVTGDHSTPALLKSHSWHTVPVLLYSEWCRHDEVEKFSESACLSGGLGRLSATHLMRLAMAHALRLNKFGA